MVGSVYIDTKKEMVSNLFDGKIYQKTDLGWQKFTNRLYRSESEPISPENGDIWLHAENNAFILYLYDNNQWLTTNRSIWFSEEPVSIDVGTINDYNALSGIIELRPLVRFGSGTNIDKQGNLIGYVKSNNNVYNFNNKKIGYLNEFDEVIDDNDKIIGKLGDSKKLVKRPKNEGESSDKIIGYVDGNLAITFEGQIIGKIVNNKITDKDGNISYKTTSLTRIVYDYDVYGIVYTNPSDNRVYVRSEKGDYKLSFDGEEPNRSLSMATALSFNNDLYPQLSCRKSVSK